MTEGQWYDVTRIVHLVGGLRAINKAGSEVVIPLGSNDPIPTFSIDKYHDLELLFSSSVPESSTISASSTLKAATNF